MSKKSGVNFMTDQLKKLVDDKTSCVTVHKSVYNLQLYPYHLSDISSSIKELLNAKIAKYDKKLDGILLGYKKLKLLTPQGSIIYDSCYIHVDIEGEFYIFKPEINSLLTGIVNKKIDDHVGCLVHRLFNVSVPNTDEDNWAGQDVNIGDEVILRVVFMDLEARLPYIKAQLVETTKKAKKTKVVIKKEEEDSTDFQNETPTKKKKKRDKIKLESADNSVLEENNIEEANISLKKKKKKIKIDENKTEDSSALEESITEEAETSLKKKKKKIKIDENKTEDSSALEESITEEAERSLKKKKKKIKIDENKTEDSLALEESITEEAETSLKKKKKKIKIEENITEDSSVLEESITEEAETSLKKKKKIKKEKNVTEETKINNNGSQPDLNLDELSKKTKNTKINKLVKRVENQSEKKKEQKSEGNKITLNTSKSKNEKNNLNLKLNGHDALNTEEFSESVIIEQLVNFNKSPPKEKKRKSKEHKQQKDSTINIHEKSTFMADAEDRNTKKRRSSGVQKIVWDNKELELYDSDLENILGESSNSKAEESIKFNLAQIAALNESNKLKKRNSSEDFVNKKEKKRKRKHSDKQDNDGKSKKRIKLETSEDKTVKKKTKTNKNKS